jgi:hypothetical protein
MRASTSVQVGGAIGPALVATFATERTEGRLADGESTAAALNAGYHLAYLVDAGLSLVATQAARARRRGSRIRPRILMGARE